MTSTLWTRAKACALGFALPIAFAFTPPVAAQTNPPDGAGDLDCLAQAVYYEARGESPDGQAAVAQVVINRSKIGRFPSTVCGVVYQGRRSGSCQFSFVCNGALRSSRDRSAWERARAVASRALGGYVMEKVRNATSFHALRERPKRLAASRAGVQIGGQVFIGEGRSAG